MVYFGHMETELVSLKIPAESTSRDDITAALDTLIGTGNYQVSEEYKPKGFHDDDLGYSPEVAQFVVSIVSGVVAGVITNLITAELQKTKERKKERPKDESVK